MAARGACIQRGIETIYDPKEGRILVGAASLTQLLEVLGDEGHRIMVEVEERYEKRRSDTPD